MNTKQLHFQREYFEYIEGQLYLVRCFSYYGVTRFTHKSIRVDPELIPSILKAQEYLLWSN